MAADRATPCSQNPATTPGDPLPLDPALSDLLDKMATSAAYVRPAGTDLAGARRSHEADASRFTPPDQRAAVAGVRDTRIAAPAGPLPVRIYRPLSSAVPLPTIVWYHGGGWTTGSLETGDIVARALSSGTPAAVVSVAYRLGPEHPWPAATDDAATALQWAAAHIGELGGDPARIAAGGDSAGGNLAAVMAQLARDSGPHLAAQILIYPVLDLDMDRSDRYPSLRDNADGYHVTRDDLRWCVRNYLPAGSDPADPRISPARHADLAGLPATVLAVAEYDPLRDQGTAYAEALRAASVPVALHAGRGLIHGCFDMLGITTAARDEIDRVLRSVREALADAA